MPEIVCITYAGAAHTEFVAEAGAVTEVNDIGGKPPLGALFSTVASDNAEVVPPSAPRGPESMWTTDAPTLDDDLLDDPATAEDAASAHRPPPFVADGSSFSAQPNRDADPWGDAAAASEWTNQRSAEPLVDGPFSAEPIPHDDDVIDSGDIFDPSFDEPWTTPSTGSVFSNGASAAGAGSAPTGTGRPSSPPVDDSPWTVVGDDWDRTARSTVGNDSGDVGHDTGHYADPRPGDAPPARASTASTATGHRSETASGDVVADPHGLEAAIARLSPVEQERTSVPIAVCGALLEADELVAGVVTGQMLGRPTAVMVTDRRVVIANDRRWQPLVDVYRIDSKLIVRGRHDRHVAALSFADAERLSMIDGIFEVELAIELAERIRDTDPID